MKKKNLEELKVFDCFMKDYEEMGGQTVWTITAIKDDDIYYTKRFDKPMGGTADGGQGVMTKREFMAIVYACQS